MSSLESRLKRLAETIAARAAAQKKQTEDERRKEAMRRYEAMDQDELMAQYHSALNAPLSPELEARFASMTLDEMVQEYMRHLSNGV